MKREGSTTEQLQQRNNASEESKATHDGLLSHLHVVGDQVIVGFPKCASQTINAAMKKQKGRLVAHLLKDENRYQSPEFWRSVNVLHVVWRSPTSRIMSALTNVTVNRNIVPELTLDTDDVCIDFKNMPFMGRMRRWELNFHPFLPHLGSIFHRLKRLLCTVPKDCNPPVIFHTMENVDSLLALFDNEYKSIKLNSSKYEKRNYSALQPSVESLLSEDMWLDSKIKTMNMQFNSTQDLLQLMMSGVNAP